MVRRTRGSMASHASPHRDRAADFLASGPSLDDWTNGATASSGAKRSSVVEQCTWNARDGAASRHLQTGVYICKRVSTFANGCLHLQTGCLHFQPCNLCQRRPPESMFVRCFGNNGRRVTGCGSFRVPVGAYAPIIAGFETWKAL